MNPIRKKLYEKIDARVFEALRMKNSVKHCPCCGLRFDGVPEYARHQADDFLGGWYWECCKTTLFVPDHMGVHIDADALV